MFQLNPLALPDAWWQHLLMLIVSGVIGYIIAYRTGKTTITNLENRLTSLDIDLVKCVSDLNSMAASSKEVTKVLADDFKIIEGIGPQIEKILNLAGIQTYTQLSSLTPEKISEILIAFNPRFQVHEPTTWPRQASLAATGEWKKLKEWQDILDGGREPK